MDNLTNDTNDAWSDSVNTIVVSHPISSTEDLGAGIISAVYADVSDPDEPAATFSSEAATRPIPRNLDALADLLRETHVKRVVAWDWRAPDELTGKLLNVFANEGVELARGEASDSVEQNLNS